MIIDLRKEYIFTSLETNMALYCDKNFKLVQFLFNNMKYKIPSYHEEIDGIHIYYCNCEIILPPSLTVYKL